MAKLVELDWSGIEAVLVGWFSRDPAYIRLAWLGVHDFLTSHVIGKPADLNWQIDDLLAYFAEIKKAHKEERDQSKRIVHGRNYKESVAGIYKRFRKLFPAIRDVERLAALYAQIAPKLEPWQNATIELAARQEFLGGSGPTGFPLGVGPHPFGYRHEFYDVYNYRQVTTAEAQKHRRFGHPITEMGGRYYLITLGDDAKRAVAYPAQSSAAGIIRETSLWLYDPDQPNYIGDLFHGQTPLRAIIHDSFLNEVEDRVVDRLIERSCAEMTRMFEQFPLPAEWGLGEALQIGVEVKVGRDWAHMEKVPVPQPWLAQLKGRPGDPAAMVLGGTAGNGTNGDQAVIDEIEDDEDRDDSYDAPDAFEFGDGWSGDTYRGEPATASGESDSEVPF